MRNDMYTFSVTVDRDGNVFSVDTIDPEDRQDVEALCMAIKLGKHLRKKNLFNLPK